MLGTEVLLCIMVARVKIRTTPEAAMYAGRIVSAGDIGESSSELLCHSCRAAEAHYLALLSVLEEVAAQERRGRLHAEQEALRASRELSAEAAAMQRQQVCYTLPCSPSGAKLKDALQDDVGSTCYDGYDAHMAHSSLLVVDVTGTELHWQAAADHR
jgi:hypothetical protein